MKYIRKAIILLLVVIMTCCMAATAFAATNTQDGVTAELTTDKTEYSSDEEIVVTLTVTNTNDIAVRNVSLENLIPDGYQLADDSSAVKQIPILNAGESVALTVTYAPDNAADTDDNDNDKQPDTGDNGNGGSSQSGTDSNGNSGNSQSGTDNNDSSNTQTGSVNKADSTLQTGDSSNIALWIVLMILAGIGIVVTLKLNIKQKKSILSLFLCVVLAGTMFAGVLPAQVRGAENSNSNHAINISTTVSVNGNDMTIGAKVGYTYEPVSETPTNYTRGEWIYMLAEKVGMSLSADPADVDYYYADTQSSSYGIAIEAAQGYGILPSPDIEDLEQDIPYFYPDAPATREFAAYTAVHAMGFDGTHSFDTSSWGDWNQIQYQNEAAVAVGNGFLDLDADMMFHPAASLSSTDITTIFAAIDEIKLADETIDENFYDNSQYAENVLKDELSDVTNYTVIENGDGTYTVHIPKSDAVNEISEGSVIVLPANSTYVAGITLKITEITENDADIILNGVEPELAEVFTKIDFAGGGTALVGEVEGAEGIDVEYDPNGSLDDDEYGIALARNINVGGSTKVPGTFKFNIGEGKQITDHLKVSGTVEVEIPNITCIADVDVGLLNVDVNEFTVAISEKIKIKGTLEYSTGSGYELSNGQFEAGRVELGRIPIIFDDSGLTFDFIFFYNFEAKASANITYTIESTQGYQYKNGSGRSLFDYKDDLSFLELKGSAKAGLGVAGDLSILHVFGLVGYSGEAGVALNASITPHVLTTDTLFCGDVALYPYAEHGLDEETIIGEYLKKVCPYTLRFRPLDVNNSNPFKLKFHIENWHRVDKCTFGMGGITGYVYALDDRVPLRDARVNIYSDYSDGNDLLRTLYTNADGMYSVDNLTEGTYRVVVSATGYFTYEAMVKVEHNQMSYIENMLMVDRDGSGESSLVTGTIVDAVTGSGVTNTSYVLREGWYNQTGDSIASGTFEDSSYSMTLGIGNYTLEISKEGYVTNYVNIAVSENMCTGTNVVLSPVNSGTVEGELRIVLTWGEYPEDLDSHLVCVSGDPYHTYFSDMEHYDNDSVITNLDIDDIDSYGPETTTVYQMRDDDNFSFYVHDYINRSSNDSSEMSNSGARVQVYLGGINIATYSIPANHEGTLWHVFDFEAATGTITPVNTFSYHEDVETVGGTDAVNMRMMDKGILIDKVTSAAKDTDIVESENDTEKLEETIEPDVNADENIAVNPDDRQYEECEE